MRALGFETTRSWCRTTVQRVGPCLLGLFTIVSLIYHEHLKHISRGPPVRPGYEKPELTLSDAIAEVQRLFWEQTLFAQPRLRRAVQKLPRELKKPLFDCLCQAL